MNCKKLIRVTIFVLVVLSIVLLDLYFYYPIALPANVTGHSLQAKESFVKVITEPNQSFYVTIGVSVLNGFPPYKFVATWPDNFSEVNSLGVFSRFFEPGQVMPPSVLVSVSDSDKQKFDLTVSLSNSSTTSSSSITMTEATSTVSVSYGSGSQLNENFTSGIVEFVESGLPHGYPWSLSIDGQHTESVSNQNVFIGTFGNYSFAISYPFTNLTNVYSISPLNGTVNFDKITTIVNITFSQIPVDELLMIKGEPSYTIANNQLFANVTYSSQIPIPTGVVAIATLYDSSGNLISTSTSSANVTLGNPTTFEFSFPFTASGQFTLDVSTVTTSGDRLSNVTAISLSH